MTKEIKKKTAAKSFNSSINLKYDDFTVSFLKAGAVCQDEAIIFFLCHQSSQENNSRKALKLLKEKKFKWKIGINSLSHPILLCWLVQFHCRLPFPLLMCTKMKPTQTENLRR